MADNQGKATLGSALMIAGAVIGAGVALLYAPQSGDRTRKQICRYARKTRNEAEEMVRDSIDNLGDLVDDLGDRTSELLDRGNEVAEDWRKSLLDALDQGQKGLERQRKRLSQLWS